MVAAAIGPGSAAAAPVATPTPAPTPVSDAIFGPGCTPAPTTKAFARYQDTSDYSLAPGGDFEHGSTGWTLVNSAIVNGNESVGILPGSHSLLLGASRMGGNVMAISPPFCVSQDHPTFRFMIRSNTSMAVASGLLVQIDYRVAGSAWVNFQTSTIGLQPSTKWVASSISPLATKIPAAALAKGVTVRLNFLAWNTTAAAGGLQIDDLMIDPYRRS